MSPKLRQRCLLLFVSTIVGLLASLCLNFYSAKAVRATSVTSPKAVANQSVEQFESEGKQAYTLRQFERAISLWQQAVNVYAGSEDNLNQARVLSNIALAYDRLNEQTQAQTAIATSLDLIDRDADNVSADVSAEYIRTLAQIYNNGGIIRLNQGQPEQAISSWSQAKVNYAELGDDVGVIRASINQATAFKQLGLYRRALKTLTEVDKRLAQQPDSLLKATGLRSYGDILRLVGQVEQSSQVLSKSLSLAQKIDAPEAVIKGWLSLGNSYKSSDFSLA